MSCCYDFMLDFMDYNFDDTVLILILWFVVMILLNMDFYDG